MKTHNFFIRIIASLLCVLTLLSAMPLMALAAWKDDNIILDGDKFGTNGYYNVISKKDYVLVPGAAVESDIVLNNATGTRRQEVHVIEVDPSNPDVSLVPGYYGIDKFIEDPANRNNWHSKQLTETVRYYEEELDYNVVGAMNTGLAYDCEAPFSFLVYNGQVLVDSKGGMNHYHTGTCATMLCVYKNEDGTAYCELRTHEQGLRGDEWQAIGANFGMVLQNGELVNKSESRTGTAHPRSLVGIKADGTLVLTMVNGRVSTSAGLNDYELGEFMQSLGCVWAFNCDGGGSSTFVTKRQGETAAIMRSTPSDGGERATLNSILVVSNVAPTGVLGSVDIRSDYEAVAPYSEYTFTASALDTHGYAMDMPADIIWSLSDDSFGTIENGKFTSNGELGTVDVQVSYNGAVVGQYTIAVMDPYISVVNNNIVVPYGASSNIGLRCMMSTLEGEEKAVYITSDAFDFTVDPAEAGYMDGFNFVASSETAVTIATLKATYKYCEGKEIDFTISLGRGTEILWDFEDAGDLSDFTGNAMGWPNSAYRTDNVKATQATAENGKVHDGSGSLRFEANVTDMGNPVNQAMRFQLMPKERVVIEGAKAIGAWVYLPNELWTLRIRFILRELSDDGTLSGGKTYYTMQAVDWYKHIEEGGNEGKWVYFKADIDSTKKYVLGNYADLADNLAFFDFQWHASIPNTNTATMFNAGTVNGKYTLYIDTIQVDYSDAVADREAPAISDMVYLGDNESTTPLVKNVLNTVECEMLTINSNILNLRATIREDTSKTNYTGLDYASAKILVDGVATPVKAIGEYLTLENYAVADGVHRITFIVADKQGNETRKTRWINVQSGVEASTITLTPADPTLDKLLNGSLYWVNLNANQIETIKSVSVVIDKNSVNHWELEHMIVAEGFTAAWSVDDYEETATITLTRTGENTQTGAATLAQLPIRIIDWDDIYKETEKAYWDSVGFGSPEGFKAGRESDGQVFAWPQDLKLEILRGEITFVDSYTSSVANTFANECFRVNTLWYSDPRTIYAGDATYDWLHIHTLTNVDDENATCTTTGYMGRTYCTGCASIIDWGTEQLGGHDYEMVENKFVCSTCNDVYEAGTGIFEMNGKLYYAIGGNLMTGWQSTDGGYCFAYAGTYQLAVGTATINGISYDFGTNGITAGTWIEDDNGSKYSYGPGIYTCATAANPHANVVWATIGGQTYAFDRNGYRHENISILVESNSPAKLYEFTTEGVLIGKYSSDHSGIFVCNNATTYLKGGTPIQAGLIYEDGYYYYINSGYVAVTGSYNVTRTNGLLEVGIYNFDGNGRMINPPGTKNGVIDNCLYINGVLQKAYQLVEFEGNYYFINNGRNEIARNIRLYLSEQFVSGKAFADGTPIAAGYYDFDADGKMVIKHGIIDNCIYINGVLQKAYQLVESEGNYYFINNGRNEIARNIRLYLSEQFVSGKTFADGTPIAAGYYDFDADGKMVIKHGIIDNCIYINGVLQKAYQLVEFEGNYYFINNGRNEIARNIRLYLSEQLVSGKTFADGTPIEAGYYDFDTDGKMVIKHGIIDNCIYINGVLQKAYQLVEFEGNYYFINNGRNEIARNIRLYLSEQFVSGKTFADGTPIPAGYYDFDADGKMLVLNGPNADGFFYINGVKQRAYQLIKHQGDYYFINDYNKYAKDKTLYLNAEFLKGTGLNPWYYTFDTEGKMVGYIDGLYNGRDIGDIYYMKTTDGKDLKSGLFIRGSELDGAVSFDQLNGIAYLNDEFNVKTEIDLRGNIEAARDVLGEKVEHLYFDMVYYDEIFAGEGKVVMKQIFDVLCDENNYPLYVHCTNGVDRVGTVSYILGAVLEISESDLCREYMLSHNAYGGNILKVQNGLREKYPGDSQKDRAEAYLIDCGITQEQIDALREIYLAD